MSRPISVTDTLTVYPSSLDTTNSNIPGTYYNNNNLQNAFTDSSSSTRAAPYTNTGSNATTTMYLNFDCSSIPSTATINSISCTVKCGTQGTNYYSTRTVQLCAGTTAKGSATTMSGSNSSPSTHTLTVGTWTATEVRNAKLKFYIQRGTSNTTTEATFSIYGATLTVNYSVSGTMYTIGATSNVTGVTVDPSTQEVFQGGDGTVSIYANSLDDLSVTDNDNDITNQLVRHIVPSGGTTTTDLGIYTLVSGSFNGQGANYFSRLVGKGVNSTQTTSNYYSGGNGTIAVFTYNLTFSDIPSNATITALSCQVNGHAESTSNSNEYMCVQLICGSTQLSSELNFKSIGTSNSTQTITATTLPAVSQLSNLKLQCRLGYYGGAINGATCSITYTVPSSGNQYYWTYDITNIAADHVVVVDQAGAFIPPEQDPQKTYYPITISSINATTNPGTGTTRVQSGTNQTITITPSDPQLTLALDNGVDITNQLTYTAPSNTYTITTQVSGANYGFTLNSGTGYYVSNNTGQSNSAAIARVNMNFETSCLVTIQYINYAEATYDYGIFGQIDNALGTTYSTDSNTYYTCSTNADNTSTAQTLTYTVPAGTHYIDIKYRKDQGTDSNNDNLQWKILSVQSTSVSGEYTYTLSNISQKHSLIFIFGNVSYYFITSSGTNSKLFPDGQIVKLEGDNYKLTIVPDDPEATVTITDNNVNRTSLLEYEEGQDKYGNTVVNYIYTLTNIVAAHTLVVSCTSSASPVLWIKMSGTPVAVNKVWKKVNGSWVEQTDLINQFDTRTKYVWVNKS